MTSLSLQDAYRQLEERVQKISHEGAVAGSVHLCLGHEAIPAGAVAALRSQNKVLYTYRGYGWAPLRQ